MCGPMCGPDRNAFLWSRTAAGCVVVLINNTGLENWSMGAHEKSSKINNVPQKTAPRGTSIKSEF